MSKSIKHVKILKKKVIVEQLIVWSVLIYTIDYTNNNKYVKYQHEIFLNKKKNYENLVFFMKMSAC